MKKITAYSSNSYHARYRHAGRQAGRQYYGQRGFTILELMVAVTLLAIISAFAIPGYRTMVQNNNITNAVQSIVLALNIARSEAIKRNRSVFICGGSDTSSGLQCGTGEFWNDLIIVYYDMDGTATAGATPGYNCANPPTADCALHLVTNEDIADSVTVSVSERVSNSWGTINFIRMRSTGAIGGNDVAVRICDNRGASKGKRIWLGSVGKFQVGGGTDLCSIPAPP